MTSTATIWRCNLTFTSGPFDLKDRGVTTSTWPRFPRHPWTALHHRGADVWMMNKDSAAKDAAWEFIKYYISEEVQEKVVHHASEVPVNRHVGGLFLSQAGPPNSLVNVLDSFEFANTLDQKRRGIRGLVSCLGSWHRLFETRRTCRRRRTGTPRAARGPRRSVLTLDVHR